MSAPSLAGRLLGGVPQEHREPGAGRVLVADDDPTSRELLALELRLAGYDVDAASDGAEALDRCLRSPPDAVVTDVLMPRLDGFRLCLAIRQNPRLAHLPVIVVSAKYCEQADLDLARKAGASAFVVRGPKNAGVLTALRAALATPPRAAEAVELPPAEYTECLLRQVERLDEVTRRLEERATTAETASQAKGAFLANMSHEIRTPMNAILGYAQLLQRDPRLDRGQRKSLEIIARSGDHLLAVINDVLEISKIEAGFRKVNRATVDVEPLLGDLDRMFRLGADAKELTFTIKRSPEVPRFIVSDEAKLRQVLVNLLSNAVKFTRKGGVEARVFVRRDEEGEPRLVVEIEDTGPGMAPHEIEGLFRPFAQTASGAEASGGTGLGLALSREYARLMGGDLTVASRAGEGSVFRLAIPLETRAARSAQRPAARTARVVGILGAAAPPRVLIADDREDDRGWLHQILQQVGFDVRDAADGIEALAAFDAWAPHVILMDLHMPYMDGYTAMRAIRARPGGQAVAIVAVTASAFDDARPAIFEAGADAWLPKPCDEHKLLSEIARLTGIQYRQVSLQVSPTPPDLKRTTRPATEGSLPPETITALRDAALVADYERLCALIQGIPAEHAHLAEELLELVEVFAYDQIDLLLGPRP